jgi:hypothetical protein
VIKTATLRVTKRLWLNLVIATLVSLPIIHLMGSTANAEFVPPPPDPNRTTGRTGNSSGG